MTPTALPALLDVMSTGDSERPPAGPAAVPPCDGKRATRGGIHGRERAQGYGQRVVEPAPRSGTRPHVVAVVVSSVPPTDRRDAVLAALAAQEGVSLSVVVVDTAGEEGLALRVHRHLPAARVERLCGVRGRGAAVNRVVAGLAPEERRGYMLVCHDDAAPEPGAVRALLHAALEWDADVVGPKLVAWDDPRRLVDVGRAVDRLGITLPYVESGEIDQGQHDGLREVFTVPGACTLVRVGRFSALGGFDEAIDGVGDDLSLCWRARVAGARVLVTTAALVRCAEAGDDPSAARHRERLVARHRLRVLLTCYGVLGVMRVVPAAAGMAMLEALGALATGRLRRAGAVVAAWPWNALRPLSLLRVRRTVRRTRRVRDREIRRLHVRGVIGPRLRLRRLQRRAGPVAVTVAETPRAGPAPGGTGEWSPTTTLVALGLAAVVLFGSRHLLTQGVPAVGEMVPFGGSPRDLIAGWASGWRDAGVGSAGAPPTAVAALGAFAGLFGGATGLARTVATVGLLPLGVLGAYRLLSPSGSRTAQLSAAVGYAAVPLPYNALAAGRWSSLAAYAAAPWLLGRLARASAVAPFGPPAGAAGWRGVTAHPVRRHVVATGAVTGLTAVLVPQAPALALGTGVALVVGSLLAWQLRGIGRIVVATVGGAVLGALLHLPVALDVAGSRAATEAWLGGERPPSDLGALEVLRFQVGEVGDAPLGYALAGAAVLPLLIARDWRLGWAIRGWVVAAAGWGLVWAQGEGRVPGPSPHPDVVLAPAAAGLVLALALGITAIAADVRGRSWRLGFRRIVTACGLVALAAATLPVASTAIDGWWGMPRGDFADVLAPVDESTAAVPSRVLWLGHPDVLPGGRGWPLLDGIDYATSTSGTRRLTDLWPGAETPAARRISTALDLAASRETSRLGRLLAPAGVQFVVVPQRAAPTPFRAIERAVPEPLIGALAEQLDLERVEGDAAVVVYRNTAFAPVRAVVPDPAVLDATSPAEMQRVDLSGAEAVLTGDRGPTEHDGALPGAATVVHAVGDGDRWVLEIGGRRVESRDAFGWATAYETGAGGVATLRYEPPRARWALVGAQVALWLLVGVVTLRMRFAARPTSPPIRVTSAAAHAGDVAPGGPDDGSGRGGGRDDDPGPGDGGPGGPGAGGDDGGDDGGGADGDRTDGDRTDGDRTDREPVVVGDAAPAGIGAPVDAGPTAAVGAPVDAGGAGESGAPVDAGAASDADASGATGAAVGSEDLSLRSGS